MTLSQFYKTDYRVSYINCLRQYWKYDKKWSCLASPKERFLLLYFDGCSARYTLSSGHSFTARDTDIVFCPAGSEYSVEFFDFASPASGTVGINFQLEGQLPDEVECFHIPSVRFLIDEIELLERFGREVIMKYNILLCRILTLLGEQTDVKKPDPYNIIAAGVAYLKEHLYEDIGMDELADMSNVSEVYFRRLFKKEFGISAAKYRIRERLLKAEEYLRYTESSVSEIADLLGFVDSSYFIKKFKEKNGMTPLSYRSKF